jgi:hypothetical protein
MNKMLLTAFFYTALLSSSVKGEREEPEVLAPFILENEVLTFLDGLIINGKQVGSIMQLRIEVNKRRLGDKSTTGFVGKYMYKKDGRQYSIFQLKNIEQKASSADMPGLQALLKEIKDELIIILHAFLEEAKGAKGQMVALIAEWAQKTHRGNSQLLEWAKAKDDHETQNSYKKITSFVLLDQFCSDLVHFLETLLRSCPNACQQFKAMMEQKQKELHQPAIAPAA